MTTVRAKSHIPNRTEYTCGAVRATVSNIKGDVAIVIEMGDTMREGKFNEIELKRLLEKFNKEFEKIIPQ